MDFFSQTIEYTSEYSKEEICSFVDEALINEKEVDDYERFRKSFYFELTPIAYKINVFEIYGTLENKAIKITYKFNSGIKILIIFGLILNGLIYSYFQIKGTGEFIFSRENYIIFPCFIIGCVISQ